MTLQDWLPIIDSIVIAIGGPLLAKLHFDNATANKVLQVANENLNDGLTSLAAQHLATQKALVQTVPAAGAALAAQPVGIGSINNQFPH